LRHPYPRHRHAPLVLSRRRAGARDRATLNARPRRDRREGRPARARPARRRVDRRPPRLTASRRSDRDAAAARRGIRFTAFVDCVERELPAAAGQLGKGVYSPLGSYPEEALLALVARVGEGAGMPTSEVLRRYGAHLFRTLATLYPVFVD